MREIRITHRTTVEATAEKRTFDRLGQQGVDNDNDNDDSNDRRMELKERENEIMVKPDVAQERNLCCTVIVRA